MLRALDQKADVMVKERFLDRTPYSPLLFSK
jgi:hypothetical protein